MIVSPFFYLFSLHLLISLFEIQDMEPTNMLSRCSLTQTKAYLLLQIKATDHNNYSVNFKSNQGEMK